MPAPHCHETRHNPGDALPTHRHDHAYAALVVDGSHVEACLEGPVACAPGTLLLHPRLHAHGNRFGRSGARVLNLLLPGASTPTALMALVVADRAEARRVFAHGDTAGLHVLMAASRPLHCQTVPWQAALVAALRDSDESIQRIATRLGVSSEHASRALLRAYGMGPQALRREWRWRHALSLLRGDAPLAQVAAQAGFTDQSHFHRVARACTGTTPARLRRQIKSVQDGAVSRMAYCV